MTATDVLNLARSQIGTCEIPLKSNSGTPYHAWYGSFCEGWQWCAIFVTWVLFHVDPLLFWGLMTAYSGDYWNVGRMHLREIDISQIAPGDIVIWDKPIGGITDHIGFVETVAANTFTTIEGNSGDCVKRNANRPRVQTSSCRYYFVRPNYSAAPKPQEDEMGLAQIQQVIIPGHTFESAGLVNASRKAVIYLDLVNQGPGAANATVKIQKPNGDFGEKKYTVPISTGAPGKVSQGLESLEVGQAFGDANLGNVIIWVTSDQPTIVIKSQTLV